MSSEARKEIEAMGTDGPDAKRADAPPTKLHGASVLGMQREADGVAAEARAIESEGEAARPLPSLQDLAQALDSTAALCRALLDADVAEAASQPLIEQAYTDLTRLTGSLRAELAAMANPATPADTQSGSTP
jgi:hypothetical protein